MYHARETTCYAGACCIIVHGSWSIVSPSRCEAVFAYCPLNYRGCSYSPTDVECAILRCFVSCISTTIYLNIVVIVRYRRRISRLIYT
ncbi:hypothetical protein HDV63DRAFT_377683 [Trichoderma sp. SZMC 28014]